MKESVFWLTAASIFIGVAHAIEETSTLVGIIFTVAGLFISYALYHFHEWRSTRHRRERSTR